MKGDKTSDCKLILIHLPLHVRLCEPAEEWPDPQNFQLELLVSYKDQL